MNKVIAKPRSEMSSTRRASSPIKIDPEKIRDVIGKGGVTIRSITEETGAAIDVADDGTVKIFSVRPRGRRAGAQAHRADHRGRRGRHDLRGEGGPAHDFGAFVQILPGRTAWCTSRRSRRSASRRSATSSARATSSR